MEYAWYASADLFADFLHETLNPLASSLLEQYRIWLNTGIGMTQFLRVLATVSFQSSLNREASVNALKGFRPRLFARPSGIVFELAQQDTTEMLKEELMRLMPNKNRTIYFARSWLAAWKQQIVAEYMLFYHRKHFITNDLKIRNTVSTYDNTELTFTRDPGPIELVETEEIVLNLLCFGDDLVSFVKRGPMWYLNLHLDHHETKRLQPKYPCTDPEITALKQVEDVF